MMVVMSIGYDKLQELKNEVDDLVRQNSLLDPSNPFESAILARNQARLRQIECEILDDINTKVPIKLSVIDRT